MRLQPCAKSNTQIIQLDFNAPLDGTGFTSEMEMLMMKQINWEQPKEEGEDDDDSSI